MSEKRKNSLSEVFTLAWQFVKRNGFGMSEALRKAWANIRLKKEMAKRVVKFYFQKVDGTIREAYGTLNPSVLPQSNGSGRRPNDTLQVYYDTERQEFRSFKKANLIF